MIEQAGEIDVLVNDAGVFPGALTHEIDEDTFDIAFAVNVKAPFFQTAALAPKMAQRGHGAIVNVYDDGRPVRDGRSVDLRGVESGPRC